MVEICSGLTYLLLEHLVLFFLADQMLVTTTTLLLDGRTDYKLRRLQIQVILSRRVLCGGFFLDHDESPVFLSSGLCGGSHDDLHVLR